jgi:hypothetical protein
VIGLHTFDFFSYKANLINHLMQDKPFSSMVTSVNTKSPKMHGGIWVEMICQRPNTSNESVHKGDCSKPDEMKEFHWLHPR